MARKKRASASAALKAAAAKANAPVVPQAPASAPPPPEPPKAALSHVVLTRPFSFYGDTGSLHRWQEGAVVTDPVEIAMLIERKAPLKEHPQWDSSP